MQATEHVITSPTNGVSLAAWSKGKGPTIVLIHSLGGSSSHFTFLFKRLTIKGYRVIAFDLRGHGKSSQAITYTAEEFASDLKSVLTYFKCDDVAIVGHGLGGYIAQCLFFYHQKFANEKVARLILLSSFVASPCTLLERFFFASASSGLLHALCQSRTLARMVGRHFFGFTTNRTMLEEWRRSILNTPPRIWKKCTSAANRDLRSYKGIAICVPTLVLCGDHDIFYRRCQKFHFAHLKGSAERIWLDRMGHMTPWEAPDRLTSIFCHFIPQKGEQSLHKDQIPTKAKATLLI
jgi:pimeloyl-ACP methyl ester carboxylesterase